ncbi:MAG: DUF1573 domain-containing protein [Sphingobacteriia bacterium]|nr:DUF1573 domain-containing protein [Sphingobacteriia bacterium]
MKQLLLITALFALTSGLKAQSISIKNEKYQMGKIPYGKPVEYVVEITNTGKDTLTMETARAGCGCTTPNFTPNQKFGPGQSVKVNILFNGSVLGNFTRFTDIVFAGGLVKQVSFSGEGVQEPAVPKTNNN